MVRVNTVSGCVEFVMIGLFRLSDPHGGGGRGHAIADATERSCQWLFLGGPLAGQSKKVIYSKRRRLQCLRPAGIRVTAKGQDREG